MCKGPDTCPLSKSELILQAAVEEFVEHGFQDGSMDRITARAGVSKRTVYKHFCSKEKLFGAIVDRLSLRMAQALDLPFDPQKPIEPQLEALGWAEARLFLSKEFMGTVKMVIGESMHRVEFAEITRQRLDTTGQVLRFMRAVQQAGALDIEDHEVAATEFLGLLKARGFWPAVFSGNLLTEADMTSVVEGAVQMMLCRYRPAKQTGSLA